MTATRETRTTRRAESRTLERKWWLPLLNPAEVPGRRTVEFAALLLLSVVLTFIGVMMVLSASTVTGLERSGTPWYFLQRQGMWAVLGLGVMLLVMRIDYRDVARSAPILLAITTVLLILVLVPNVGHTVNGATRWLVVGPLTIQPSEFAKLALALFCSSLLARRAHLVHDHRSVLAPILVVALGLATLVILEPSQGSATIIVAIAMMLMFLSGVSVWSLGSVSIGLLSAFAALALFTPYRRARLLSWSDPFADPDGAGYQSVQSLVGIANGGVDGVGLGAGRAKWGFLPEAHTDFIFSVVAEEFGFIGGCVLILLFVVLALVGVRVAMAAPDRLGMLIAGGITSGIVLQAFINIGATINVLPISGVTLPFVSMGGSSLVVNLAGMGVVLNVARQVER